MALSDGKKTSNEKETFLLSKTWKTILATRLLFSTLTGWLKLVILVHLCKTHMMAQVKV